MSVRPPSGSPPPVAAELEGHRFDLVALAQEIADRYYREYPDEIERYGDAGMAWCQHDNQWLLAWAVDDVRGVVDLDTQASWLARVLHARAFPVDRLVRDLQLAADVMLELPAPTVTARLSQAASAVEALGLGSSPPPHEGP